MLSPFLASLPLCNENQPVFSMGDSQMKRWGERLTDGLTAQRVGLLLLGLALLIGALGYISQHPEGITLSGVVGEFYANLASEMVGIAITVLIIDSLNRRREEKAEER